MRGESELAQAIPSAAESRPKVNKRQVYRAKSRTQVHLSPEYGFHYIQ